MLTVKEKGLLLSIIKHCNKINKKMNEFTREQFNADEDIVEIICFNILQIGELAKNFDSQFIATYNKVPWNKIKGMRDKVAHGYDKIDMDRVWYTALDDITPLLKYCEEIIKINEQ